MPATFQEPVLPVLSAGGVRQGEMGKVAQQFWHAERGQPNTSRHPGAPQVWRGFFGCLEGHSNMQWEQLVYCLHWALPPP